MNSITSVSKYLFISLLILCFGAVGVSAEGAAASGSSISLSADSRAAGVFDDDGNGFELENVRLNVAGSHSGFDATASVQYDGSDLTVLDASLGTGLYKDLANVKVGRFLVPADRNAENDIYHNTAWNGTNVVSKWASPEETGRGDGVSISGTTDAAKGIDFSYDVGIFNGGRGDALVAARLGVAVEELKGLDIGVTIQSQNDAFRHGKDFFGAGVDVLYTTAIEPGTVTLTGSYANYDLDGARYTEGVGRNAGSGFSVGGAIALNEQAKVASLNLAFEPFILYQNFDYDDGRSGDIERFDVGANFNLVDFANSKVTVQYFNEDPNRGRSNDGAIVGLQVVF